MHILLSGFLGFLVGWLRFFLPWQALLSSLQTTDKLAEVENVILCLLLPM